MSGNWFAGFPSSIAPLLPSVPDGPNSDYPARSSQVGGVYLTSISGASIAQFGDRADIDASLRGLAVQREADHLRAGSVYFESYAIFDRPTPSVSPWLAEWSSNPLTVDRVTTEYRDPRISVGCIEVIAVSSSAMILVGNGVHTKSESRISNIRQFATPAVRRSPWVNNLPTAVGTIAQLIPIWANV